MKDGESLLLDKIILCIKIFQKSLLLYKINLLGSFFNIVLWLHSSSSSLLLF